MATPRIYKEWTEDAIIKQAQKGLRFFNTNPEGGVFCVHSAINAGGKLQPGDKYTCATFASLRELRKGGVIS